MRSTCAAELALRLAAPSSSHRQYVCRACRAQAARQFHMSRPVSADIPFYKRLQQTIFGSKDTEQAEMSREEKQKRRLEEAAQRAGDEDVEQEVKIGKDGQRYEVAALVDPSISKQYVQALNWDGLERVGSKEWVKARADRGEQYVGFVPKKRIELSNRQWQMLFHHVIVEILVLQKAGRAADEVCYPRIANANLWSQTRTADIKPSATGTGVNVAFADPQAEARIRKAIPKQLSEAQTQDQQALSTEVEGAVAEGDELFNRKMLSSLMPAAWMEVSVRDPSVKMALLKRTSQLTGKRLPDTAISSSATLADLYNHLRVKEQLKKLAKTPQMQRIKLSAPNVKVFSNRQTLIHKEKEIGRWKVIEEELVRRDLPVTGSRWQGAKTQWQ